MRTCVLAWLVGPFATTPNIHAAERVDYESDVQPILQTYCLSCHTAEEAQGGLIMETHAELMTGGDSGVSVTAGVPASSRLLLMTSGKMEPVMPPDDMKGPSESELAVLEQWIAQGAIGPKGKTPMRRELRVPEIAVDSSISLPVTAIAVSSDGKLQATARFGVVTISRMDGKPTGQSDSFTLAEKPGKINSLRFNDDNTKILVASGVTGSYGLASIHDLSDPVTAVEPIAEFAGHRDTLYAAEWSPDQNHVATAGYDREILLWNVATGKLVRKFKGHNGAIYSLAFSPDGQLLVSGCADETVKVWRVDSGQRLDTLSQSEGEVFAVAFTPDGKQIVAAGADNRFRAYKLVSKSKPRTNPILATRFLDPSRLIQFAFVPTAGGKQTKATSGHLVVMSESGTLKVLRCSDWTSVAELPPVEVTGSDLSLLPDGKTLLVSLMDGRIVKRTLTGLAKPSESAQRGIEPIFMDLPEPTSIQEPNERVLSQEGRSPSHPHSVPRSVRISGVIEAADSDDRFAWDCHVGEVWAIDADAAKGSRLDPFVTVLDERGDVVVRAKLQAIRDSYFTFRGKDSTQSNDFRLFAWEEMHLNDYLYANGEVTKLWIHPRGPDSGFNVYPGRGSRLTYFGTTHATHALGEPAFVVRELDPGETPTSNGLPVFEIPYQNDDDPQRRAGKNSRLLFTAPETGRYTVAIRDARGEGGDNYGYTLAIRAAKPSFRAKSKPITKPLQAGTGREFEVTIDREDGFDGPVVVEAVDLPETVVSNLPLTVQAGQNWATGMVWMDESVYKTYAKTENPKEKASAWKDIEPKLVASATIGGVRVERDAGSIGKLTLGDRPSVIPRILPLKEDADGVAMAGQKWTLRVRRGETVSARVILDRKEGFVAEVPFGKEFSGRSAAHGVYVDNIGLNGLLVVAGANEREFFLTADPVAELGPREFFLTAGVDGGVTTQPIVVEVLP